MSYWNQCTKDACRSQGYCSNPYCQSQVFHHYSPNKFEIYRDIPQSKTASILTAYDPCPDCYGSGRKRSGFECKRCEGHGTYNCAPLGQAPKVVIDY